MNTADMILPHGATVNIIAQDAEGTVLEFVGTFDDCWDAAINEATLDMADGGKPIIHGAPKRLSTGQYRVRMLATGTCAKLNARDEA